MTSQQVKSLKDLAESHVFGNKSSNSLSPGQITDALWSSAAVQASQVKMKNRWRQIEQTDTNQLNDDLLNLNIHFGGHTDDETPSYSTIARHRDYYLDLILNNDYGEKEKGNQSSASQTDLDKLIESVSNLQIDLTGEVGLNDLPCDPVLSLQTSDTCQHIDSTTELITNSLKAENVFGNIDKDYLYDLDAFCELNLHDSSIVSASLIDDVHDSDYRIHDVDTSHYHGYSDGYYGNDLYDICDVHEYDYHFGDLGNTGGINGDYVEARTSVSNLGPIANFNYILADDKLENYSREFENVQDYNIYYDFDNDDVSLGNNDVRADTHENKNGFAVDNDVD